MSMVLRGTVIKGPDPEEPAQELFSQRRKPEIGQFRLQMDRQTKATFSIRCVSPALLCRLSGTRSADALDD
jgi:hypothetical protein